MTGSPTSREGSPGSPRPSSHETFPRAIWDKSGVVDLKEVEFALLSLPYGRVISWKHWVPPYLRTAPSGSRRLIPVYRCLDFPIAYPAGAGPTFQGGFCPTTSMIGMHHGHCDAMAKNQRNKHAGPIRQLIDMILTGRSVPLLKQDRMTKTMIKK